CSAMAIHHLGETIDIHGGGLDLVFPHHENEVAQSESFTGKAPFARFWMHNGLLRMAGDKMSKSLGNLVNVRDALEEHSPDAIRLWMLSSHYRNPLLYDEEAITAQERAARRLRTAVCADSPAGPAKLDPAPFEADFIHAMDDDLNTPAALAGLFDLARDINRSRDAGLSVADAQATLRRLAGVLGLTLAEPLPKAGALSEDEIDALILERAALRARKRFDEADAIRARLAAQGVLLRDSPEGTTWSRT
ncbi:MAG: class I tRNA ligase family protein, partial [Gemmatimonadetes bacterium]|nr:class I tRNA ligase family protein [Gemmatimonadota bacterium]